MNFVKKLNTQSILVSHKVLKSSSSVSQSSVIYHHPYLCCAMPFRGELTVFRRRSLQLKWSDYLCSTILEFNELLIFNFSRDLDCCWRILGREVHEYENFCFYKMALEYLDRGRCWPYDREWFFFNNSTVHVDRLDDHNGGIWANLARLFLPVSKNISRKNQLKVWNLRVKIMALVSDWMRFYRYDRSTHPPSPPHLAVNFRLSRISCFTAHPIP